jgi:hypothetical protein
MIAEESTKQYRQEQKELGIKKETEAIVVKARKEQQKVEALKSKLRQSVMGGVISNNLASVATRMKERNKSNPEP